MLLLIIVSVSFLLLNGERQSINKQAILSTSKDFWLENGDILLYLETITQIKNHDLYLKPEMKRLELIQDTLRFYVAKTDPYAAYMIADEFTKWKKSQGDLYVGIGMEIVKDSEGQITCLPYAGSPAEKAGIRPGDHIISIDGEPVRGRSILAVGSMARGGQDTSVNLLIMTGGQQKNFNVKRSPISFDSVSISRIENISVIKIPAFTRDTKVKLESALAEIDKTNPFVFDLRGNAGGDLSAAIDSAMLFLDDHKKVVSIKTRQGIEKYESGNGIVNSGSQLFLWQDEGTASAAEVFIAALTNNHRAVSIGKKSFGKGTKQEIFEMSDGSALFITTGFLQTPDGLYFDGKGLHPDYTIESNNPQTIEYLLNVKGLLKEQNQPPGKY
jgi:carboxyl-terminal processing protease